MSTSNGLERDLARWMEDVAPKRAPENLTQLIGEQTRSMQPRPRWLARLLEPQMQTQFPLGASRAFGRPAMLIFIALLALALIAGTIVVGAQILQRPSIPAPFGVAGNGLIAADIDGGIVLASPDGTAVRPLDLPFTGLSGMSFSRDGTRFAAWSTPDVAKPEQRALVIANADGSGAFDLDPETRVTNPSLRIAWSPDDQRLAFTDGSDQLYIAHFEQRRIQPLGAAATDRRDPTWGPDGRLAYRCGQPDGTLRLCVMDGNGTNEEILPTAPGTLYAFQGSSWSPDGRYIAYYIDDVDGTGGWDVATIDLETSTERILTRGTTEHTIYPAWSSDGQYVLFVSGVVRADGSDLRSFGEGGCNFVEPSPDGAFATCLTDDGIELWPIAGGEPTLIPLGGAASTVSWQRVADR